MQNLPLIIGKLQLPHRLIQGPLAGFSCAPFRSLFSQYTSPAYCVTEMLSAHDVLYKHTINNRYLYRSPEENYLCYQISGTDPFLMRDAAVKLEGIGADLIDINCGCPKPKIRKKGAGSALLEDPNRLIAIIQSIRVAITCPLTVKIRIQGNNNDIELAKKISDAGADALIVHGRRWTDDYDKPCNLEQIALIKEAIQIPVIVNGDIADHHSLHDAINKTQADAFMISRAGMGKPWLFKKLLDEGFVSIETSRIVSLFMMHLEGLAALESEYQAVLQSKSLVRYYFRNLLNSAWMESFYKLSSLEGIVGALQLV